MPWDPPEVLPPALVPLPGDAKELERRRPWDGVGGPNSEAPAAERLPSEQPRVGVLDASPAGVLGAIPAGVPGREGLEGKLGSARPIADADGLLRGGNAMA